MKLLICGVPPNKIAGVSGQFPTADVRCIGAKESTRIWQQRVRPADACIVLTHLTSHKNMEIVRNVFGRGIISSNNLNQALATAQDLVRMAS